MSEAGRDQPPPEESENLLEIMKREAMAKTVDNPLKQSRLIIHDTTISNLCSGMLYEGILSHVLAERIGKRLSNPTDLPVIKDLAFANLLPKSPDLRKWNLTYDPERLKSPHLYDDSPMRGVNAKPLLISIIIDEQAFSIPVTPGETLEEYPNGPKSISRKWRVPPRYFKGLILQLPRGDRTPEQQEADNKWIKRKIQEILQGMTGTCQKDASFALPIYDSNGTLLWPNDN